VQSSIHTFSVEAIEGGVIDFADFKGKKLMVVNGASECGFTPQYQQLQELHEQFEDQLVILVFPANNFGGQEPGTNEEIRSFCTKRYGVTFPLAAKIDIRTHPVYQWLTRKAENGFQDSEVTWNFQKYLLDEEGRLVQVLPSSTSPLSDEVLQWLDVL
jgi:glutathione peroxidase